MTNQELLELVANVLSTATILSCLFLKVPQIMSIREKKSADGIYVQALLLEIVGFSIMILYNYTNDYSIMTYLEYPIIIVQIYMLLYYVLKYKRLLNLRVVPLATSLYFATMSAFVLGIIPCEVLAYLVPFNTPLSGFAKVTYIFGIIKTSNADAVSLTTWLISLLTNLSRLFTVYVDSGDTKLMINFMISSLLSFGVLATAMLYKRIKTNARQKRRNSRAMFTRHYMLHED